jgi:formylglycine-generating enzyme required for sulfatase activity
MPETKRPLKVFLCHASLDKPKVRELYRYLRRRGIRPWFDEIDLVGGQDWQIEIPKALATSDAIIICLTKNSVDREGYVQKEIKFALDKALEMPEGRIFLIPVRFEECEVPFSLSRFQWVDLFDEAGYTRMMRALKFRASQLERATVELPKTDIEAERLAVEKAAREKQEREATEKADKAAQEKSEREVAEKVRKEKAEREAAEKVARDRAKREAAEKARRERAERQAAQIAALKEVFSKSFNSFKLAIPKAKPFLRFGGIIGIVLVLLLVGSRAMAQFLSFVPIATASLTLQPASTIAVTNSPTVPTSTPKLNATPTKTRTPTPTSLPTQITDAKGVSMVFVLDGEFTMGENGFNVRKVELDSYYIDKYEVTNAQYRECVSAQQCGRPSATKLGELSYYGNSIYDSYPVVWMTKGNAEQYCAWRGTRLPTLEEWEKAARGTDQRSYPWGNQTDLTLRANGPGSEDGFQVTAPVGSFPRGVSPYGAFDMAGNVSEFISDNYVSTSTGLEGRLYPIIKGGDWYGSRFSQDWYYLFSYTSNTFYQPSSWIGFRCVRDANS